jgi:hypothetical protein
MLVNVFNEDNARSNEFDDARNGTPALGALAYWPTVRPPVPCAVTVIDPADDVLVALAVPAGFVFDALTQLLGGGRNGAGPVPPHGGGVVLRAATGSVSAFVAVVGGNSESVTLTVKVLVVAETDVVPVMNPLEPRERPDGRLPETRDHV